MDANNNSISPPPDDWPSSRHVTGTGNVLPPTRSGQASHRKARSQFDPRCVRRQHPYNPQGVEIARAPRRTGVPPGSQGIPHSGVLASRTRWRLRRWQRRRCQLDSTREKFCIVHSPTCLYSSRTCSYDGVASTRGISSALGSDHTDFRMSGISQR